MLKRKGFLGPIGDDLPSLIPLVFALTIFFGVFYLTFNAFNERTQDFGNDTSAIQISAALRGAGLLTSSQHFQKLCESINIKNIDFAAGIINAKDFSSITSSSAFIEWNQLNNDFKCANIEEESIPSRQSIEKPGTELVQRLYPVAVSQEYSDGVEKVTPSFLVVTVWRD